jgi:hypothetical protein
MKTSILNLSAIAILIGSSFFAGRIQFGEKENLIKQSQSKIENIYSNGETNIITQATYYKGELIPLVYLPEFTVESDLAPQHLVQATLVDGEIIPFVTLPTLTIEG